MKSGRFHDALFFNGSCKCLLLSNCITFIWPHSPLNIAFLMRRNKRTRKRKNERKKKGGEVCNLYNSIYTVLVKVHDMEYIK